ncbi:MAG: DEAD/DEAH box helicase family protein [Candidatus Binataceae bacterium]
MALAANFPTDPHAILDPEIRWYPGEEQYTDNGYAMLIPPLVFKVRVGVKAWRDSGYAGASETTRALLNHWFNGAHLITTDEGASAPFRYYFGQREAVESAIWLYEVEEARDPYALIKFDSSGRVSKGMFDEDWTRYVMKLATGTGKTKVMSLLVAWAYFHKRYEAGSELSTNFLLIAPNIIVLDRLRRDFDGLRIFHDDPVLPENGYEGQNWRDDFQPVLHVQDQIGAVAETGNIFLTNIQRVYESGTVASFEDNDTTDYFLGRRPAGKTNQSQVDLGRIIRDVPDLVVINDEAHHIHDPEMTWFKNIEDIANQLRLRGSKLSAQFDLTATPKHSNGAIFVQTISDYPLVEAIRQHVVKIPVLPDEASQAKLSERKSDKFTERYEDYLHLGYLEWRKVYDELKPTGNKAILFVMTDDTRNCDEVGAYLEARYPDLGRVLVIHTKRNGEISEASSAKSNQELNELRKHSQKIDDADNPYKAIVSVMMLREGWDVRNVVAMVGLRPYKAPSQILPEQTLGRGLRPMFRGQGVRENVSVIGTQAFMTFVESIRSEGIELELAPMGERTRPKSPLVVEVDRDNPNKDIERLDLEMPILTPRIYREFKNLNDLNVSVLPSPKLPLIQFTADQQREIIFKDIDQDSISHTTVLDSAFTPSHQSAVGFFASSIKRELHMVGGFEILFGKLKEFMESRLFDRTVDLDDLNVLRNLSEPQATRVIFDIFKKAINELIIRDKGTTQIRDSIKLSRTRPFVADDQGYLAPKKSIFSKVIGNSGFELEFAAFLDGCDDIISFVKNSQSTGFKIEYQAAGGGIRDYYPDFLVKAASGDHWIVETKGREDIEDPLKWRRLRQWCADASALDQRRFRALFVRQEQWEKYHPRNFAELRAVFEEKEEGAKDS